MTHVRRRGKAKSVAGKIIPKINPEFCFFKLRVGRSKIHRWGLYAAERIPARRKVMEYMGERISRRESKRRADIAEHVWLFTVDPYWNIDGSVGGSGAELANHCCDPNLYAWVTKGHVLYMSKKEIRPGEELTIDYHFGADVERVVCKCGSLKCRGTINIKK